MREGGNGSGMESGVREKEAYRCFVQGRGERAYDIFSRLLKERIVCLMGPVSLYVY